MKERIALVLAAFIIGSPACAQQSIPFHNDPIVTAYTAGTTAGLGLAAGPRAGLIVQNASASATITLCTVSSAIVPVINVAGCITLPAGGSMVITNIPMTSGLNVIASAAATPVTFWTF